MSRGTETLRITPKALARADISDRLEELSARSQAELYRLDQQHEKAGLELDVIRSELGRKREEKNRILEELVRLSTEPLFAPDLIRLRKSRVALDKDGAKFQKKIEDLLAR